MSNHVIITGPGRSGTSFLLALFTRLGLDTGFTPDGIGLDSPPHAGLERGNLRESPAYIVKSPWLTLNLTNLFGKDFAANPQIKIDHAIVPLRPFAQAAASRVHAQQLAGSNDVPNAPGGLWLTADPNRQLDVLRTQFASLCEMLAARDIPLTLLWFPRLVLDSRYLFDKLPFLFMDVPWERFDAVFRETSRPDWIHDFSADAQGIDERSAAPTRGGV